MAAPFLVPRLVYGAGPTTFNFTTPVQTIVPSEARIKGSNISLSGFQETLSVRIEPRITLGWSTLSAAELTSLRTWFRDWASLGEQSALTLDYLATAAGQWEYDIYNTFFTKAECLYNPFEPRRLVLARKDKWVIALTFRQGQ